MSELLSSKNRRVLTAPLRLQRGPDQLGRALWLYLALVDHANHRGRVLQSRRRLSEQLGVSEGTIDRWLMRLAKAKLLRVLSSSAYLAISLAMWSTSSEKAAEIAPASSSSKAAMQRETPSSSEQQAAAAAAAFKKNGDGGLGEGGPTTAAIRAALDEPGLDVTALVEGVPAALVRKALDRVQQTPPTQIRKSKAALFRYLLKAFTRQRHDPTR